MDKNNKIAVLMTVYNETEEWLRDSISSVLDQTYKNIHFYILLDNPENDKIRQIILEYVKSDERITFLVNDVNLGLVSSLNKLLTMVEEEYIARMDADDISLPERLSREMAFMKEHNLDFAISNVDYLRGEFIDAEVYAPVLLPEDFAKGQKFTNFSTHPTWLLKKQVYDELGGYRNVKHCEDYDFVLRAIQKGFRVGRMKDVLLHYRMRENGISISYAFEQYEKTKYIRNLYKKGQRVEEISCEYLNHLPIYENKKRKEQFFQARNYVDQIVVCLRDGNYMACLRLVLRGSVSNPAFRQLCVDRVLFKINTKCLFKKAERFV